MTWIYGKYKWGQQKIFRKVEQIDIEDINLQAQGYLGLEVNVNLKAELPDPVP